MKITVMIILLAFCGIVSLRAETIVADQGQEAAPKPQSDNIIPRKALSSKHLVEIFVVSWCPHCHALEDFLVAHNLRYKKYDIERFSSNKARYASLGGTGALPLIKVGKNIIEGFDQKALVQALMQ